MAVRAARPARAGKPAKPGAVRVGKSPWRKLFHQAGFLRFSFKGKKFVFQFRQRRVFSLAGRVSPGGSRHFLARIFLARMFSGSRRLRRGTSVSWFGRLRGWSGGIAFALLAVRLRGRSASLRVRRGRR